VIHPAVLMMQQGNKVTNTAAEHSLCCVPEPTATSFNFFKLSQHQSVQVLQKGVIYNRAIKIILVVYLNLVTTGIHKHRIYEGWNFNSGNYLFTTDTK